MKEIKFIVLAVKDLILTSIKALFLYLSLEEEKSERADAMISEMIIRILYL